MATCSLHDLETPCVVVDVAKLEENVSQMQEIAVRHGLALRPHIKTHKCTRIADLQLKSGAVGITAAKPDEAIVFMKSGVVPSITLAYPVIGESKLDRLVETARVTGTDLRMIVDSEEGLAVLKAASTGHSHPLSVYIKIDVGLHRCGLGEKDDLILILADKIVSQEGLTFVGLLSHAGHSYGARTLEEVASIAEEECAIMVRTHQRLEMAGYCVKEVSIGSTPTVLASDSFDGVSEIRPGNYVFLDLTCVRFGLVDRDRVALKVLTTIVSKNKDYYIFDAGSKVLSSDAGGHGLSGEAGFGEANCLSDDRGLDARLTVVRLSEEHGFIKREDTDLHIGDRLLVTPNHACPVTNLADELVAIERGLVVERWEVDARGCVR